MIGPFLASYLRIWFFFGSFLDRFGCLAKGRSGNPGHYDSSLPCKRLYSMMALVISLFNGSTVS